MIMSKQARYLYMYLNMPEQQFLEEMENYQISKFGFSLEEREAIEAMLALAED